MTEARKELEELARRGRIILAHLDGADISAIAREVGVSRPTVRKWVRRWEVEGVAGLLSRSPPGRPREIPEAIRKELVRLVQETRPPADMGDVWTTRTLAEAWGCSPAFISDAWKSAGFDPPAHVQQVEAAPERRVSLRLELRVPAWLKLHLALAAEEQGVGLADLVLALALQGHHPRDLRPEVLPELRERWHRQNEQRPRVDPRDPTYRHRLRKEERP